MDLAERDSIVAEVKAYYAEITGYSEKAALDDFLKSYDDAPDFLHISSDGTIRKAAAFKKVCSDYYNMLDHQKISTISQEIHIIGPGLVIVGWSGNILAHFKNGDTLSMTNYSITNVLRKSGSTWKIIHAHESALPPKSTQK